MKIECNSQHLHIQQPDVVDTDAIFTQFHISRKQRYAYYQNALVSVNGRLIYQNRTLSASDSIHIRFPIQEDRISPWYEDVNILYEDELLCIVDKPVHLLVHSDGIQTEHTLCNLVKAHYLMEGNACCVRPLHRLDLETSGAVAFCKIPFFQPMLDFMLRNKEIYREYDALVTGCIQQTQCTISQGIARDRHDARKMRICEHGKPARTDVVVKQVFTDYTWVHCRLHTGRTHQIRVHMAFLKHPLLSDSLYGTMDARISRLALHASRICIPHPLTNQLLRVDCPLPDDMQALLRTHT